MQLYKLKINTQCSIDARQQFFLNRIVDMWNSLPAAVVLGSSVALLNESRQGFFTLLLTLCLYVRLIKA